MNDKNDGHSSTSSSTLIAQTSTEFNACSLEVLLPVQTDPSDEASNSNGCINTPPIAIGCYQLMENPLKHSADRMEGNDEDNISKERDTTNAGQQRRMGQLRLCSIESSPSSKNMFSFGSLPYICTLHDDGVLDLKWLPYPVSLGEQPLDLSSKRYILASALSSGSIQLHSLEKGFDTSSATGGHNHLRCIAFSSLPPNSLFTQNLCLSLDWEYRDETSEFSVLPTSNQILSSYSNGQVAIHTARWGSFPASAVVSSPSESRKVKALTEGLLEETVRFDAHTLFGEPSEVWTCCWCRCTSSTTTILSGADDCKLKGWDTRVSTQKPIFCITEHEAGVTALSWHPREQYIFASGSYDEGVRIWDIRSVSSNKSQTQKPMAKLPSCGGGVWRLKWHPLDSEKLLVAAMHGGCHILHVHALNTNEDQRRLQSNQNEDHIQIMSSFTEHKSMAYGADWFPVTYFTNEGAELRYLAVSCSFYDQQAFLWDPCSCSSKTVQSKT